MSVPPSSPRRRNPFAILMARAPWLVSGLAAVGACAAWLLFNHWAVRHAPALSQRHPLVALPSLLLIVAILSIRAWPVRRKPPVKAQPSTRSLAAWRVIARHASSALLERGFVLADDASAWQPGTDLELTRDGRTYIVHARHWRKTQIDANAVHDLARQIAQRGASGGMLLCPAGVFTDQARQLARLHGIATLGRADLADMFARDLPRRRPQASAHDLAPPHPPAIPAPVLAPMPVPPVPPAPRPDQETRVRPRLEPAAPRDDAARPAARPASQPQRQADVQPDFSPTIPMNQMLPARVLAEPRPDRAVKAPPRFDFTAPRPRRGRVQPWPDHQVASPRAFAPTMALPEFEFEPESEPGLAHAVARPSHGFAPTGPMPVKSR